MDAFHNETAPRIGSGPRSSPEVAMLVLPPRLITPLAHRIGKAFLLYDPPAHPDLAPDSRIWRVVATGLVRLNRECPEIPVDPELFVRVQVRSGLRQNPWVLLTHPEAFARYRAAIERIVLSLARELLGEVHQIGDWVGEGIPFEHAVRVESKKVSPLGRYLASMLANEPELARSFQVDCGEQLRACPLFEQALRRLLPDRSDTPVSLEPIDPLKGLCSRPDAYLCN